MSGFYNVSFLLEIITNEPIFIGNLLCTWKSFCWMVRSRYCSYFKCRLLWLGPRRARGLNQRSWNLRSVCHHRDHLLVHKVQWFCTETTDPRCGPWEGSDLEDTSKDLLPLFGLSQHSEGCPALGASFIPFIRPGVKHKPANSVKISDGWLLRNSNCFKCGSQQSNVPLWDEITTPWAHSLCALHSLCVGDSQRMSSLKKR